MASSIIDTIHANVQRQLKKPTPSIAPPQENPRNTTKFGTSQATITSSPTQVSGPRPGRESFKLTNTSDTVDVYVGNSASVSIANGDLLPAGKGQWVSYPTASPVFAIVALGVTAVVTFSETYD